MQGATSILDSRVFFKLYSPWFSSNTYWVPVLKLIYSCLFVIQKFTKFTNRTSVIHPPFIFPSKVFYVLIWKILSSTFKNPYGFKPADLLFYPLVYFHKGSQKRGFKKTNNKVKTFSHIFFILKNVIKYFFT